MRASILDLRQKTRAQKKPVENGKEFHLKYSCGGGMDIEFLTQYCLLMHAHRHPSLVDHTDVMRQIDGLLAHACLSPSQSHALQDAWRHIRALTHSCVLRMRPRVVPFAEVRSVVEQVRQVWRDMMHSQ